MADAGFRRIVELITELGLPINPEKVVSPVDDMTCMGIVVNADKKTIRVSETKIKEILQECQDNMSKRSINRKDLQSLLGKLLYVAKIVLPAHAFLNRLLAHLRGEMNAWISVDFGFRRDLTWFIKFLQNYNNNIQFDMVTYARKVSLEVDAS